MKTIRVISNLTCFLAAGFFAAGCYTQLESTNNEDSGSGDNSDTTYSDAANSSGGSDADNYFNDDGYRSWRYRMAFHYYSPSPYVWGTEFAYDPWYDDNWGGYYPGLWYPTLVYPYPYWYPGYGRYPHYGYGGGYGYWSTGNRGYGGSVMPGRRRTTGSTRGNDVGMRTRGTTGAPSTLPAATSTGTERTRVLPGTEAVRTPEVSKPRVRQDVPWWERARNSSQGSSDESRAVDRTRKSNAAVPNVDRKRGLAGNQAKQGGAQQNARRRNSGSTTRSGGRQQGVHSQPSRQPSQQGAPHYSPPSRDGGRSSTPAGKSEGGRTRKN